VSFECEAVVESCTAFLVITGDQEESNEVDSIFVEISTSSLTNSVDWSVPETPIRPFHIYAKVIKPPLNRFKYDHLKYDLTSSWDIL